MSSQWNIKSSYDPTKKFENPKIEKAPQERLAFNFSFDTG